MSLFLGYEVAEFEKDKKTGRVDLRRPINPETAGQEVKVPIFHMLVTGQTQLSGKTTTLKTLARQASEQGFKILIIDSKTNMEDYEGFGQDVPVCLQESIDAIVVLRLAESILTRKLTNYYPTITRIVEGAKDFDDIIDNARQLEEEAKSGWVKDAARGLADLITRVKEQAAKAKSVPELELPYPINRMAINEFSTEGQQLIVRTIMLQALKKFPKNLVIIIDEAFKFLPQKYRSACHEPVQQYVTQGAGTGNFLWMSTQFLAPTSKDAMKAMPVKLLGTQDHGTECQHTVELIPFAKEAQYTTDKIMTLRLGHFIVVTKNPQMLKTVYVVPEYADKQQAYEVAMGWREPKNVTYLLPFSEEEMKKLKESKPLGPPGKTENRKTESVAETKVEVSVEPIIVEKQAIDVPVEENTPNPRRKPYLQGKSTAGYGWNARFELMESNIEALRSRIKRVEERLEGLVAVPRASDGTTVSVNSSLQKVNVTSVEKHIIVDTDTVSGQVLLLAKEGFFEKWRKLAEVREELEKHKYTPSATGVQTELRRLAKKKIFSARLERGKNYYVIAPGIVFEDKS